MNQARQKRAFLMSNPVVFQETATKHGLQEQLRCPIEKSWLNLPKSCCSHDRNDHEPTQGWAATGTGYRSTVPGDFWSERRPHPSQAGSSPLRVISATTTSQRICPPGLRQKTLERRRIPQQNG